MRIEPIHLWRWIGTESELNSLFIHQITIKSHTVTPSWTATSSKLSLLGTIHAVFAIRDTNYDGLLCWDATDYYATEKETTWHSRSTSFTTSDKVWQINRQTLVCVSILLQCWLNKPRVEIVTCTTMGVARQQQFSYNSVSKFWQCERDQCGFNSHSMHIE